LEFKLKALSCKQEEEKGEKAMPVREQPRGKEEGPALARNSTEQPVYRSPRLPEKVNTLERG